MAGRKRLPDHLLKAPRKGEGPRKRAPYNIKPEEERGKQGPEPLVIKSFWKEYSMNQIEAMTDEEIMQAIDKSLDDFEARSKKHNKDWDWPIEKKMLAIDPNVKK
jgi:hypothetical protein